MTDHPLFLGRRESGFARSSDLGNWQVWSQRLKHERSTPKNQDRLLVLPFDDFTGSPGQAHVASGLIGELITCLVQSAPDDLAVIARTTAVACKGTGKTVLELADDLALDYVIEGSLSPVGDTLKVTVQLIDARSEIHPWAETRHLRIDELLRLQSEIAAEVANRIAAITSRSVVPPSARNSTK